MNRAIDASTSSQARICGVDNGINLHFDNISSHQCQCYSIDCACSHKNPGFCLEILAQTELRPKGCDLKTYIFWGY